jgi:preprotein translocase subunit SecA
MFSFLSKLLDLNAREVERLSKIVKQINEFDTKAKKLKDKDFAKKTQEFKERLKKGESFESVLPEAFAVVREASYRAIGLRHFDVQLMASVALFEGKVAEQKTGEGKTLSAVPALYLRSLLGRGAHLVTVNDYLARRDAGWNAPTFNLLGLSVGVIIQESKSFVFDPNYSDKSHGDERLEHLKPSSRREAYECDITYGTNNEFGFDYLRDNMAQSLDEIVQSSPLAKETSGKKGLGEHYFAVVDEVDSVLIDEARTPLIISAPDTEPTQKYYQFAQLVEKLNPDTDFKIDEKSKTATLTDHGIARVEKILGIPNLYEKDFDAIHHIENALRAKTLFLKDRDYIVKDNQVIIVDEFTGRLMFGRRWSDGLHQAVEAKEGVPIQQESKTLATISFQNYFRMYEVLSGMTGTAATEAEEFKKIYKLDVVVIPTHKPMIRVDHPDLIYKTLRAKYGAIVSDIEERYRKGQPVLVGTTSIEKNEIISQYLKRRKIPHNVLNAKNHEKEASIIADAGKPGAVTVATNMAGRGVDIVLGGAFPERPQGVSKEIWLKSNEVKKWQESHDKVVSLGGLYVIGTERHESRRIDNQLRGRSGRQGDPGSSRFYLSLEDDLMRIFGGDQIKSLMDRLSIPEDQPIENRLVSRAIEQAQVKVEGFNFDLRKSVVEYDDVANQQREVVYKLRRKVLMADKLRDEVFKKLEKKIDKIIASSERENGLDYQYLLAGFLEVVPFDDASKEAFKKKLEEMSDIGEIKSFMLKVVEDVYEAREKQYGKQVSSQIDKFAYLSSIDHFWIEHIDFLDSLRENVRLQAYAQKDPLVEFKNEAYNSFENLIERIDDELTRRIFRIGVMERPQEIPLENAQTNIDRSDMMGLSQAESNEGNSQGADSLVKRVETKSQQKVQKIGRNDPCWCGAKKPDGTPKKFKHCHYPKLPDGSTV